MQQVQCEVCGEITPGYDMVSYGSIERGYRQLCGRCFNANDLFTGESGVYVYEEMPDLKRTTGITGRGLERLTDAIPKDFAVQVPIPVDLVSALAGCGLFTLRAQETPVGASQAEMQRVIELIGSLADSARAPVFPR